MRNDNKPNVETVEGKLIGIHVCRTHFATFCFSAAERQVIDVGLYLARASIGFIDSRQHTTLRQCRAFFLSVPCALAGCVDRAGDLRPKFLCA